MPDDCCCARSALEDRVLLLEHALALLIVTSRRVYESDLVGVMLDVRHGESTSAMLASLARDMERTAFEDSREGPRQAEWAREAEELRRAIYDLEDERAFVARVAVEAAQLKLFRESRRFGDLLEPALDSLYLGLQD